MKSNRFSLLIAVMVAVFVLLTETIAVADDSETVTIMYVSVSSQCLRGRAEPNTDSIVEARFVNGTEVEVVEISGKWAKVKGGEPGYVWCFIDYLTTTKPGDDPVPYTVKSNGRVNVRNSPDMDGDHVRWLENGDTVQVQSWFDGWAYVGDGYTNGNYLTQSGGSNEQGS